MGFKDKAKMTLFSTFFKGTYKEYKQLTDFKLEREELYKSLQDKEEEIKEVYEGNKVLDDEINFLKYRNETLIDLHDKTVEKYWNKDEKLKKYTCLNPFCHIEILPRGEVYTCCSSFVKHDHYIGNINTDDFEDIWNSKKAKQLRYSVSMGNFEYCNSSCISLKTLDLEKSEDYLKYRKDFDLNYNNINDCELKIYPKTITLSCDVSCNLYCTSCRKERKVLLPDESKKIYDTLVAKVLPLMKDCEQLSLLGSGDFFMSKASMNFVKHITHEKFPKLELHIITNAQLFNEKNWSEFDNLKDIPIKVDISIDASRKESYEKIRRGAKWEILLQNLGYIASLKQKGQIVSLRFNFVAQLENFKQMKDFIKLAKKYNADAVWFQRIANWGTISKAEFLELDVFDKKNEHFNKVNSILEEVKKDDEIKVFENCL